MSVIRTILALAGLAFIASPAFAYRETQERIVTPAQLEKDDGVRGKNDTYQLAASALYIHKQCTTELEITPEQLQFVESQFKDASQSYFSALDQAFVKRTQSYSTPEWKQKYADYLREQQQPVIDQTAKAIETKGCEDDSIKRVVSYFEKLRKAQPAQTPSANTTPQNQNAAAPAAQEIPKLATPAEPSTKKE